jgi:hypothetical protein
MQTLEEILAAARQLPEGERKRLVAELQGNEQDEPTEEARRGAMEGWLVMAGSFHSDYTDVSTDKYKHLAEAYADKR